MKKNLIIDLKKLAIIRYEIWLQIVLIKILKELILENEHSILRVFIKTNGE